jgi:hypothetical protein
MNPGWGGHVDARPDVDAGADDRAALGAAPSPREGGGTLLRFTSRRPGIARAPPSPAFSDVNSRSSARCSAVLSSDETAESAGAGAGATTTRAGAATAGAGTGETSVAIPASSSAAKSSSEDDEALMRARAGKCVGGRAMDGGTRGATSANARA